MDNPSSPLDTLRQLKEMLDAGALTPTEFEALKQRLVFNDSAAAPSVPPRTSASPPTTEPAPAAPPFAAPPAPVPPAASPVPAPEPPVATTFPAAPASPTSAAPPASPPQVFTELRSPRLSPETSGNVPPVVPPPSPVVRPPSPLAAQAPPLHTPPIATRPLSDAYQAPPVGVPPPPIPAPPVTEPLAESNAGWVADEFPESETTSARSPLALILSIGGLLALLGLVVYLALNRPPSERISSTSLTAADSVAAPIETGPQVEQVQAPTALPETVRVRPANPAPALPARPRPAPQTQDSVSPSPAAATDSVSP